MTFRRIRLRPSPYRLAALAAAGLALLQAAAAPAAEMTPIPVPESITVRHVPAIDSAVYDDLLPFSNIRSASLSDWHPTERRMLITSRFAQTTQLHEVAMPGGARSQVTYYDEGVPGGLYRPGDRTPAQIAFVRDAGGDENYQIFLLDLGTARARRLTDGVHRHRMGPWSPDGNRLAFVGNGRNGRDLDPYVIDLAAAEGQGEPRRITELEGSWGILDWSPDGRQLLLHRYVSINESYLHALDVESGALRPLTPADEAAGPTAWDAAEWSVDGKIYLLTDRGSEFLRLARLDPESLALESLSAGLDWNVEGFALSDDGRCLAYFLNEDGISRLHLLDPATGEPKPAPELPDGVAGGLQFRPGSHEVGFSMSWARAPRDAYSWDPASRRLDRWTVSETGGLDFDGAPLPRLVRYPTFDAAAGGERRTIPAFVYHPSSASGHQPPYPVYVEIHGGPEGQIRPGFIGATNFMVDELGVALIRPNVRGSDGYGKSYLLLDNGMRREDSVKDIGALLDWIATQPDLDAGRVMVGGGSYGGYMVLASLTHYSDRLRGGYDVVGISNFVTFLNNTQAYRRDLRRAEYGDDRDPAMRAHLEAISPSNHVDRITRPLLVAQGANDPRVPLSESDQIVAALEGQGTPVWYVVAANEGHGFRKKVNSDYLRAVQLEFVRQVLLNPASK